MSLKSFLHSIGHLFENIFGGLAHVSKVAIHWGVVITENMKNFVESDAADILTMLIPGQLDDKIKLKLRAALPDILIKLKLADQCLSETDPALITACAIKTLQSIEGSFKSDFLDALAVQISLVASDGRLTWDEAKSVLKWYYDHKFKANPTVEPPVEQTEAT